MEMKKVSGGKLRAIGYDAGTRTLQVEMDSGSVIQYIGVSQETFRRLSSAGSPWSFFRDNIEEDFPAKRIR
ncbi:MAG: KTSC domain-containing protein [Rhodocyclaceae bacterium]